MAAKRAAAKTGKAPAATKQSEKAILDDVFSRITKQKAAEQELDDEILQQLPPSQPPQPETGVAAEPATTKRKGGPKLATSNVPAIPQRGSAKGAMITYHPGREDKSWTVWFGIKFDANLPKQVFNQELIGLAKNNPWFSVDGKRATQHKKPIKNDDEELDYSTRSGGSKMPDGEDPEDVEVEMQREHLEDA